MNGGLDCVVKIWYFSFIAGQLIVCI